MFLNSNGFVNCEGEELNEDIVDEEFDEYNNEYAMLSERKQYLSVLIRDRSDKIKELQKKQKSISNIENNLDQWKGMGKIINKNSEELNEFIDEYNEIEYKMSTMTTKSLIDQDIEAIEVELEKCISDKDNADQHRLNAFKLNCILEEHRRELSEKNIQYVLDKLEDKLNEKLNELYRKLK